MRFINGKMKKRLQRGLNSMEIIVVLSVIAVVGSMLASSMTDNAKNMKAKSTAEKLKMVVDAAEDYMVANRADLLALTGGGAVIAIPAGRTCSGCGQPATPGALQTLQADGFLPSSYIDVNGDQQSHALLVKQVGGELEAIVTTYGGAGVDDDEIGHISSILGASAGGVYNNAVFGPANQISGAQGSWGDATANWAASIGATPVTPTAGTVQVSMSMAEITGGPGIDPDDVLHRTAQPDVSLNTMDTTLLMDGNTLNMQNGNISNAGTVTGSAATLSGDVRGARFVDQNDPANFYINPNGASRIANLTTTGSVTSTGAVTSTTSMTAPRYYDTNNTAYYMDPHATSIANVINVNRINDRSNTSYYMDLNATSRLNNLTLNSLTVSGTSTLGTTNTGALSPSSINAGSGAITTTGWITGNRFVDSENSARYLNPASGSQLQDLTVFNNTNSPTFIASNRVESPVYVTTSDRRLKDDIKDLEGLEIIKKLSAKSYTMKESGKESMGLIAQDVEEVLPFAVHTNEETDLKAVNYIELIAPMIDAIQNLDERLEAVED